MKNNLENMFVPYEQAFALRDLGFDEPCLATINEYNYLHIKGKRRYPTGTVVTEEVAAPTYSQAFRFFRDKKILGEIKPVDDWGHWTYMVSMEDTMSPFFIVSSEGDEEFNTHEEAELACLKKLIEIIKNEK